MIGRLSSFILFSLWSECDGDNSDGTKAFLNADFSVFWMYFLTIIESLSNLQI